MNGRYHLAEFLGSLYRRSLILDSCKILRDATPKSLVILDGELISRCGFALGNESHVPSCRTRQGYFDVRRDGNRRGTSSIHSGV